MLPICEDQENRARACPGYAPGQSTGQRLSQRPDRRAVAGHRPAPAAGDARAAGQAPHLAAAGDHRGDLVRGPDRVPLAVPARRLPALAHGVRLLRGLAAAGAYPGCMMRYAAWSGPPGRHGEPTAAVINSRSVRAAATVPRASRGGTTPRRSTAASGTSPSTPAACCWRSWPPLPRSRTATPPGRCCGTCDGPAAVSA